MCCGSAGEALSLSLFVDLTSKELMYWHIMAENMHCNVVKIIPKIGIPSSKCLACSKALLGVV